MNAATLGKILGTRPFNQRLYTFWTFLAALTITAAILGGGCCPIAGGTEGCDFSLCGNDFPQAVVSPDGALQAVIFQRSCGATTGFVTHVTVLQAGAALPNEGGNLFVADDCDWVTPEKEWKEPKGAMAQIKWIGPRTLRICYPFTATVYQHEATADVSTDWFSKPIPVHAEYHAVKVVPLNRPGLWRPTKKH